MLHSTPTKTLQLRIQDANGVYGDFLDVGVAWSSGDVAALAGFDIGSRREVQIKVPADRHMTVQGISSSLLEPVAEDDEVAAPVLFTVTDNGTDPAFAPFAGDYTDTGEVNNYYGGDLISTNGTKFAVDFNSNSEQYEFFDTLQPAIDGAAAEGIAPFITADGVGIIDQLNNSVGKFS